MGQKSNQESHLQEPSCAIDRITLEKRTLVKEKLIDLCETGQNIDNIITSLESYCLLILKSLEIK